MVITIWNHSNDASNVALAQQLLSKAILKSILEQNSKNHLPELQVSKSTSMQFHIKSNC